MQIARLQDERDDAFTARESAIAEREAAEQKVGTQTRHNSWGGDVQGLLQ